MGVVAASELAWDRPTAGQLILQARQARGWSQAVLARKVAGIRADRWDDQIGIPSLKSMLSRWENGRVTIDRQNREILAEAFSTRVEGLFGTQGSAPVLPRPLMVEVTVTDATVSLLREQRRIHSQTEHAFGPYYATELIRTDLYTIEGLLPITPADVVGPTRAVAALVAELGGWIAQDSGDLDRALALTSKAHAHARMAGDAAIESMVLMRWANLETSRDPALSAHLAEQAMQLARSVAPGRLHASIARQQAHAAAASGDKNAFEAHAARAAEHAQAAATVDDLTSYANPSYVASEVAADLLVLGRAGEALNLLSEHLGDFTDAQGRDRSVAMCRWLHALVAEGDAHAALDHYEEALSAFRRVPSIRALGALRAILAVRPTTKEAGEIHERISRSLEGTHKP